MNQLLLTFDDTRQGAHRKRDRQTSVDAARSMLGDHLTNQQDLVLTRLSWKVDANAYELACELGYQQSVVARRLTDLWELGLADRNGIKRQGGTGRFGDCWQITEAGRKWLADRNAAEQESS